MFNPQQQFPVTWPDHPVVALAYVDQLARGQALSPGMIAELTAALDQATSCIDAGNRDAALAARLETLADGLNAAGTDGARRGTPRPEQRREGKECVRTGTKRW